MSILDSGPQGAGVGGAKRLWTDAETPSIRLQTAPPGVSVARVPR